MLKYQTKIYLKKLIDKVENVNIRYDIKVHIIYMNYQTSFPYVRFSFFV